MPVTHSATSTAREDAILGRASAALQPSQDGCPRGFEKLELDGPPRLLLHHHCARADTAAANEVADVNLHHIATAQLAIDGKIEERSIT
jgi:hypothetical protein